MKKAKHTQYRDILTTEQHTLFLANVGFAMSVSRKVLWYREETEQELDAALHGLFKAVQKYDCEKGSLPAYLTKCIKREVIAMCCKKKADCAEMVDSDTVCDPESMDKFHAVEFDRLTPMERRVVEWRKSGLTFKEIGENLGIGTEGARMVFIRCKERV